MVIIMFLFKKEMLKFQDISYTNPANRVMFLTEHNFTNRCPEPMAHRAEPAGAPWDCSHSIAGEY